MELPTSVILVRRPFCHPLFRRTQSGILFLVGNRPHRPDFITNLYIKATAPAFERNLQKLTSEGGGRTKGLSGLHKISVLLCSNREERVLFEFTYSMLKSERKLKLRLFSSLTLGVIMPFILLLSMIHAARTMSDFLKTVSKGKYCLYAYFLVVIYSTLFSAISRSESYQGAWIYRAMPVENPGLVFRGAMKAFLYKYISSYFIC